VLRVLLRVLQAISPTSRPISPIPVPNTACLLTWFWRSLLVTLIDAPLPDEVPMPATTTRRASLRRVIARSVALLAAASLAAACSDPTAPAAPNTPSHTNSVTTGVIIGSTSQAPLTKVSTSGVIIGST
jgi:hypothetical protein